MSTEVLSLNFNRLSAIWLHVLQYLLPGAAEQDEKLRQEMLAVSHLGLQAVGWIEIAAPVFMLLVRRLLEPFDPSLHPCVYFQDAFIVVLGMATIAVAKTKWSQANARLLVTISVGIATVQTCAAVLVFDPFPGSDHYVAAKLAVMMLVTAAAGALRPVQMLYLGISIEAIYVACTLIEKYQGTPSTVAADAFQLVFVLTMSLLCTALTALLYVQRVSNYRSYQQALRATQDLCFAQSRALVSENAASMAKLAATLSHELNSPIGAVTSAAESLVALAAKQRAAPTEEQRRVYSKIEASLERAVHEGAQRLREIAGRIQRLTNMDDEKSRSANIVELLRDVGSVGVATNRACPIGTRFSSRAADYLPPAAVERSFLAPANQCDEVDQRRRACVHLGVRRWLAYSGSHPG